MENNEYPKKSVIILYIIISIGLLYWFLSSNNGAGLFTNILCAFAFGIPATIAIIILYILFNKVFK